MSDLSEREKSSRVEIVVINPHLLDKPAAASLAQYIMMSAGVDGCTILPPGEQLSYSESGVDVQHTSAISTAVNLESPNGLDLDAEGLPWDHRIHSSSKDKIANGTWKKRRGVSDLVYNQVVEELRGALGAPEAPKTLPADFKFPTPPEQTKFDPTALGTQTAPEQPSGLTYDQLVPLVSAQVQAGTLAQTAIVPALQKLGLASFPDLKVRPDLIPAFVADLGIQS